MLLSFPPLMANFKRDKTMTEKNKPFTLTNATATLLKLSYSKKAPPKPRKNAKGGNIPIASQGDEDVLKAKIGLYFDTDDKNILKCFTESDTQDLFLLLAENKNIPSISFTNHLLNYQITINEGLEIEKADLSSFKATTWVSGAGVRLVRVSFNASFSIDGRMIALLSEFWKEKIALSLEPSDDKQDDK